MLLQDNAVHKIIIWSGPNRKLCLLVIRLSLLKRDLSKFTETSVGTSKLGLSLI